MMPNTCATIRPCAEPSAARRLRAVQLRRARWAATRRGGSLHLRTSLLLPTCQGIGSILCTATVRREASCLTWISSVSSTHGEEENSV